MAKASKFKISVAGVVQYSSLTTEDLFAPDSVIGVLKSTFLWNDSRGCLCTYVHSLISSFLFLATNLKIIILCMAPIDEKN